MNHFFHGKPPDYAAVFLPLSPHSIILSAGVQGGERDIQKKTAGRGKKEKEVWKSSSGHRVAVAGKEDRYEGERQSVDSGECV